MDNENYENHSDETAPLKNKSQFYVILALVIIIGLIVFVFAIMFVVSLLRAPSQNNNNREIVVTTTSEETTTSQPVNDGEPYVYAAIIKEIDSKDDSIFIYAYNADATYNLYVKPDASLKDKYNKEIVFEELKVGDVIDVEFYANSREVLRLKINQEEWEELDITGFKPNDSYDEVVVGGKEYLFNSQLIVYRKGELATFNDIKESDIVRIKGIKSTLLFVEILKSNGVVQLKDKDKIKNGKIEIGTKVYANLQTGIDKFEVTEGEYKLVIKGENIDDYTEDIEVKEGETTLVNLEDVDTKSGALTVSANVDNYKFYIDGKLYQTNEPIILEYGTYNLKLEKEGYITVEKSVTLKDPSAQAKFTLEEEIVLVKLNVVTEPTEAEVYVNGMLVGVSPVTYNLPEGDYELVVKKEGYTELVSPVTIPAEGKSFKVTLVKNPEVPSQTEAPVTSEPTTDDWPDNPTETPSTPQPDTPIETTTEAPSEAETTTEAPSASDTQALEPELTTQITTAYN